MAYQSGLKQREAIYRLEVFEVKKIISVMELAYKQTGNENVLVALRMMQARQGEVREQEIILGEADIQEIRNNPSLFPHSVVTWAFDYRDKEIS